MQNSKRKLTTDELNAELDFYLEEGFAQEAITEETNTEQLKEFLFGYAEAKGVQMTEEDWQNYAVYCLQKTVEARIPMSVLRCRSERIQ